MILSKGARADQQKVLLVGIVFSLIARTGFIALGAALISAFAWWSTYSG